MEEEEEEGLQLCVILEGEGEWYSVIVILLYTFITSKLKMFLGLGNK